MSADWERWWHTYLDAYLLLNAILRAYHYVLHGLGDLFDGTDKGDLSP